MNRKSAGSRSLARKLMGVALVAGVSLLVLQGGPAQALALRSEPGAPAVARTLPVGTTTTAGPQGLHFDDRNLIPEKQVQAKGTNPDSLPSSAYLWQYDPPVGNQGWLGSCTTWAIDYGLLGWYSNRDGKPQVFNPMYTWSQINKSDPNRVALVLNTTQAQGNDTMAHYSRSTVDETDLPSSSEKANALNYRIGGWTTLFSNVDTSGGGTTGENAIANAIANNAPVAISLVEDPGFQNMNQMNSDGHVLDTDTSRPQSPGLHEVMAVAYDQYGLWIENSWGTTWGDSTYHGYGRMSWAAVGNLVYDARTIKGFATTTGRVASADTTPPAVNPVTEQLAVSYYLGSSAAPVTLSWSASDPSGIAGYQVYYKPDNGSFAFLTSGPSTQQTYNLSFGHKYTMADLARDGAGNWNLSTYYPAVTPTITDDTAFNIGSPWARYSQAGTYGGTFVASSQAGSSLQTTFTGRDVAWVGLKFSNAGRATVYCDGTNVGIVDEYNASTLTSLLVAQCHFAQSGQHTMKVVVEGTSGRPWVGIDAFAYLS